MEKVIKQLDEIIDHLKKQDTLVLHNDTQLTEYIKEKILKEMFEELINKLGVILERYIIDQRFIGTALPYAIFSSSKLRCFYADMTCFAKSLIKATFYLGSDRVRQLLDEWVTGGSICLQEHILLHGLYVNRPLQLEEGIKIEKDKYIPIRLHPRVLK